jgi:GntR family transcriptional regulator/MocR family aminotransferase
MNSFSHLLASKIRLGFLTAPKTVIDRLAKVRQRMDWQGDLVLEGAIARLLKEGMLLRHIQKVSKEYRQRRETTISYLSDLFPETLQVVNPHGGLSLWITVDQHVDMDRWCKRCAEKGVDFQHGRHFTLYSEPKSAFMLTFAAFNSEEMQRILNLMHNELRNSM